MIASAITPPACYALSPAAKPDDAVGHHSDPTVAVTGAAGRGEPGQSIGLDLVRCKANGAQNLVIYGGAHY